MVILPKCFGCRPAFKTAVVAMDFSEARPVSPWSAAVLNPRQ
jgi:hypothetical protein